MMLIRDWWVPVAAIAAGMVIALGQADANEDKALLKQTWQERYEQVLQKVAKAEARIAAGEKTIRKLRQRDRYQGTQRSEVEGELEAAREELAVANKEIAEFPDIARQAEIPPGWLREVEERRAREG